MKRIVIVLLVALVSSANAQILLNEPSQPQMAMTNLSSMPIAFTENLGQWNEKALFKAESGGVAFWYCGDEVVYVFTRDTDELIEDDLIMAERPGKFDSPRYKKEQLVIKARFLGANPDAEIIGADRLSHNNNYFIGNDPSEWRTDVPNYASITYADIYPGIDLKYHGNGQGMKYDFIVHPGADISLIQVRYEGVEDLSITPNGDLEAVTEFGPIHENIPSVYQQVGGRKSEVEGRYVIRAPGIFGFEVDDYNPSQTLVIDPELVYSTYLGGNGTDSGDDIAIDGSGYAYITGVTYSSNFPTQNPYDASLNGGHDAFVTKFAPAGNSLVYSTYLGGNGIDDSYSIAVDAAGNAYITGDTESSDFPMQNPYDASLNGGRDAFVTKLSPAGNSLVYSTYLGGNGTDRGEGISRNSGGRVFVTGNTYSSDFPTTPSTYDDSYNGSGDAFMTVFYPAGNVLAYSTFLGGTSVDWGHDIYVDALGYARIIGQTHSSNFPTNNAYDASINGGWDVFLTTFSLDGSYLYYSTYLGGSGDDYGYGIVVDNSYLPYVTGITESADFPTANAYDGSHNGGRDAFVTRFTVNGAALSFSTFLGGSLNDEGNAIAINNSGNVFLTGTTFSSNFPTVDPFDATLGAPQDAFVTRFAVGAQSLDFSTYLGGTPNDFGYGIAADNNDNIYVCGSTSSADFPTVNPYQYIQTPTDAFVSKFGPDPTGACCYGDLADPSCNNELQSACEARTDFIEWTAGANCDTYTCPVAQTPQIASISPEQNELAVAIDANISVTFDIDMDAASINGSTFLVNGMCTGLHAGVITYNFPSKTATFNPVTDFAPGEIVTVVLTGDIESSAGVPLADYAWSFTTASAAAPGTFAAPSNYAADSSSISLFAADLDGDGDLDLATGNTLSDNVSVLLNNGDGTFAAPLAYAAGNTPYSIFAADLDGDGDLDLATANEYSDDISVLLNNGDGTFAAPSAYAAGSYPWSVFGADLDGDGDIDLATADEASDSISVLLNNGDGTFAAPSAYAVGNGPYSIFAADLDGDGDLDLMTANDYSYNVSVLLNNGDGTFAAQSVYAVGDGPYWVFAADLDGDGDVDLATANHYSANVSVLLNNGNGTFAAQSVYAAGNFPYSVFAADLDGDGDLDLATANYSSGNVSVLLNNGNGIFAAQSVYATSGHPYWIFAADLDGDGDLDLATTDVWSDNVSVLLNESTGCDYVIGDVNGSDSYNGLDITYGVAFFKGGPDPMCPFGSCPAPPCDGFFYCGDINGSCSYNGLDITYGVSYLKGGPGPLPCGDCAPPGMFTAIQKKTGIARAK